MESIIDVLNVAGNRLMQFMAPMLIQSAVLFVAIWIIDMLIKRKVQAVFRYWLWSLLLVKLMLPVTLALPTGLGWQFGGMLDGSYWSGKQAISSRPVVTGGGGVNFDSNKSFVYQPQSQSIVMAEKPIAQTEPEAVITPEPAVHAASGIGLTWQGGLAAMWVVAVVIIVLLVAQRWQFVHGLIRQAAEAPEELQQLLRECCERLGLRREVEMRLSANATSPSVCGLARPVILIPADLPGAISGEQMRAVLLHELVHIQRGDLWMNLLQTGLQAVYFFHPLVWIANAMIRRLREQAVDEAVLASMGREAEEYPRMLLDLSRMAFARPALSLRLIGVVENRSTLKERISHIASRPFPTSARLGMAGVAALIISAAVLLPMAGAEKSAAAASDAQIKKDVTAGVTLLSRSMEFETEKVQEALTLVKKHPQEKTLPLLIDFLGNRTITKVRSAIYMMDLLHWDKPQAAYEPLKKLLTHKEDTTRGMAAMALASMGDGSAKEAIVKLLQEDESDYVKRCAAWALGQLRDTTARDALRKAVNSGVKDIEDNARNALQRLELLEQFAGVSEAEKPVVEGIWLIGGSTENQVVRIDRAVEMIAGVEDGARARMLYQIKNRKSEFIREGGQDGMQNAVLLAEMKLPLALRQIQRPDIQTDQGVAFTGELAVGTDIPVTLKAVDGLLECQSIRFDDFQPHFLMAKLKYNLLSGPQGGWLIKLTLLDQDKKELADSIQYLENSGIIISKPATSSEEMKILIAGITPQQAKYFTIQVRNVEVEKKAENGALDKAAPAQAESGTIFRRNFVRLVVDTEGEKMSFEGAVLEKDPKVRLDTLLKAVADKGHTVLEVAFVEPKGVNAEPGMGMGGAMEGGMGGGMGMGAMPGGAMGMGFGMPIQLEQSFEYIRKTFELDKYGFEYLSLVGYHPLGSKGSPVEVYYRGPFQQDKVMKMDLTSADGILTCQTVELSRNLFKDVLTAKVVYRMTSHPKGCWAVRLGLSSANNMMGVGEQVLENSGTIIGVAIIQSGTLTFTFDSASLMNGPLDAATQIDCRIVAVEPAMTVSMEDIKAFVTRLQQFSESSKPDELISLIAFNNPQEREEFKALLASESTTDGFTLTGGKGEIIVVSYRVTGENRLKVMVLSPVSQEKAYLCLPLLLKMTPEGLKLDSSFLENIKQARLHGVEEFGKMKVQEQRDRLEQANDQELEQLYQNYLLDQEELIRALEYARERQMTVVPPGLLEQTSKLYEMIKTMSPQEYKQLVLQELPPVEKTEAAGPALSLSFRIVGLADSAASGALIDGPFTPVELNKIEIDNLIKATKTNPDSYVLSSPSVIVRGNEPFTMSVDSTDTQIKLGGSGVFVASDKVIKLSLDYQLTQMQAAGMVNQHSLTTTISIAPDQPTVVSGFKFNNHTFYTILSAKLVEPSL